MNGLCRKYFIRRVLKVLTKLKRSFHKIFPSHFQNAPDNDLSFNVKIAMVSFLNLYRVIINENLLQ